MEQKQDGSQEEEEDEEMPDSNYSTVDELEVSHSFPFPFSLFTCHPLGQIETESGYFRNGCKKTERSRLPYGGERGLYSQKRTGKDKRDKRR